MQGSLAGTPGLQDGNDMGSHLDRHASSWLRVPVVSALYQQPLRSHDAEVDESGQQQSAGPGGEKESRLKGWLQAELIEAVVTDRYCLWTHIR